RALCGGLAGAGARREGAPGTGTAFRPGDLPMLRRLIESIAAEAGLPRTRSEEAVIAVNEIATNALLHGRPPAALRVWVDPEELVYEISDLGPGIENALAGQPQPSAAQTSGRGLWRARPARDPPGRPAREAGPAPRPPA